MNLGNALATLGEQESETERLHEAIAAYRAALEEWTRERVPLQWATAQMNLGNALLRLGEREGGSAPLEEAVSAYRAALEEFDARAGTAPMGDDPDEPRQRVGDPRRAGERDSPAQGGDRGVGAGFDNRCDHLPGRTGSKRTIPA